MYERRNKTMAKKRDQKDFKKFMKKTGDSFKYVYGKIEQFEKSIIHLGSQNMERQTQIKRLQEEMEHLTKEHNKTKRRVSDLKKKVKDLEKEGCKCQQKSK